MVIIKARILEEYRKQLLKENKLPGDETTIRLKINEKEREEFLLKFADDVIISWYELEKIEDDLYELIITL